MIGTVRKKVEALGARGLGVARASFRRLRREPPRVLLLKTWNDRLGDLVLMSGTLRHYRRLYADCRLDLACADPYVDFFRHCPHVDHVAPLSRYCKAQQRYSPPSPWNSGCYDRVVVLRRTPTLRDYVLLDSFRPAWTAGMSGDHLQIPPLEARQQECRLNCAVPVPAQDPPVHEFDMQMRLLRALGAEVPGIDSIWPECWTSAEEASQVDRWFADLTPAKPLVVWAPCGSAPIRDWNVAGFRRVFKSLPTCVLTMTGTLRDAQFAEGMDWEGLSHIRRLDLIGKTTILELVELLRRADLVISAETATFHLAAALRRPAICLAGGGHWNRFVPWGMEDRTRVLTNPLDCFECNWLCTRPTVECLQNLDPEAMVRCVAALLGGRQGGSPA